MPKIEASKRRIRLMRKRKYGMRVVGRSVLTIRQVLDKKSKV